MFSKVLISFLVCLLCYSSLLQAQRVELPDSSVNSEQKEQQSEGFQRPSWKERSKSIPTGKKAAAKYMNRKVANSSGDARYMAVYTGYFLDSEATKWGKEKEWEDKANLNLGVTYRVGEWTNSMDLLFKADFQTYKFDGERPYKISLMPIIAFPDSRSRFPLYFGAGLGAGIFFKQVSGESSLSLDYNLLLGVRFFEIFEFGGLNIETGLKGHMHLLSDGVFKGTYLNLGLVFSF